MKFQYNITGLEVYNRSNDQEKENTMIDMPKDAITKITDAADGVSVKKLNVEVEKDGKSYKVDVNDGKAKAEVKK